MRYKAAYRSSELLCPLRYHWVPYDIASSLLDRKPYVVLSDFATLQNKAASPPNDIEDQRKQDESNDLTFIANEDMSGLHLEDSGDESGPETTSLTPAKDISNIVIDLEGMHMKYKDTRQAFGTIERNNLEGYRSL